MQPTDQHIRDARRGDRKAQSLLYRQCYPVLMGVCVRYRQYESDAVSLMNEAFLKILKNLDSYKIESSFSAWIRRIMINTVIDDFRKQKNYREFQKSSALLTDPSVDYLSENVSWNDGAAHFDAEELENLILRLPPMHRQVFNLMAIDGFSHAEIGEILGISDGTSKWYMNQARKLLQTWMKTEMVVG